MNYQKKINDFLKKYKKILMNNHNNLPEIKKPIFIVGCGRAGTTILFNILSTHPSLFRTNGYPDGEDHDGWVKYGQAIISGFGNVHNKRYKSGINGYNCCLEMNEKDANEDVKKSMRNYYSNLLSTDSSKTRIINKCPHLSNKLKYVLSIFPDAKIIHIVRDCEANVASWISLMEEHKNIQVFLPNEELPCMWLLPKLDNLSKNDKSYYPGGDGEMFIEYWEKVNKGIIKQMNDHKEQLISIKYEDLVDNPDMVMNNLINFLEIKKFNFDSSIIQKGLNKKHSNLISNELKIKINKKAFLISKFF
tara:strand:+ start:20655 stop:21569 length:915 start_codon:yes stop_codon:yes gene_type:complete